MNTSHGIHSTLPCCRFNICVSMLLFFTLLFFCANTTAYSDNSTSTPTSKDIIQTMGIASSLKGYDAEKAISSIASVLKKAVDTSHESSVKIGNALFNYTRAVFLAIIGLIICANLVFIGFRIMLKAPIVQLFTELTVSIVIIVVIAGLTVDKTPTNIIESAMIKLAWAGRNIGVEILQVGCDKTDPLTNEIVSKIHRSDVPTDDATKNFFTSTSDDLLAEPAIYWLSWLGIGAKDPTLDAVQQNKSADEIAKISISKDTANDNKFGIHSALQRFWGGLPKAESSSDTKGGSSDSNNGELAASILAAISPFKTIQTAMTLATIQTGTIIAPVFQQVGVFAGAILAFYLVASLGVATLPLIFFSRDDFRNMWSRYLVILTGIALVPCFYYIFSAIGFVFATNAYETLFPITSVPYRSFAQVLNSVFITSLIGTFTIVLPFFQYVLTDTIIAGISKFIGIFILLNKVVFAAGITSAFVVSGSSFSLIGTNVAFKWSQGFGAEAVTEKVGELFANVQKAVSSGLSSLYSSAASSTGDLASGFAGKK